MDGADNQIFFITADAQRRFGSLIRKWTKDAAARPGQTQDDGSTLLERDSFIAFMRSESFLEGDDYLLRDDIEEVQIFGRRPEQLVLLLPEADLLTKIEADPQPHINLSRVHRKAEDEYSAEMGEQRPAAKNGERNAGEGAKLDSGTMNQFLSDYLGDYTVRQCL